MTQSLAETVFDNVEYLEVLAVPQTPEMLQRRLSFHMTYSDTSVRCVYVNIPNTPKMNTLRIEAIACAISGLFRTTDIQNRSRLMQFARGASVTEFIDWELKTRNPKRDSTFQCKILAWSLISLFAGRDVVEWDQWYTEVYPKITYPHPKRNESTPKSVTIFGSHHIWLMDIIAILENRYWHVPVPSGEVQLEGYTIIRADGHTHNYEYPTSDEKVIKNELTRLVAAWTQARS